MNTRRATRWGAVASALGIAAFAGCAYFNTLYNAKEKFEEAEKATANREAAPAATTYSDPNLGVTPAPTRNPQAQEYETVIEKCRNVIARYPDSRHVDDAMLLIGKSLYRLDRYDEAAAALDSLESRYPKTNLLSDARFLKGKSLAAAKHYEVAAKVLSDFVDHYRKHDDRPEALYLLCTCQMQLDRSDDAVATLHRLEKDHGRSSYRFRTQTDMAKILAEKKLYDQSLAVYRKLSASRIPENVRYDVWVGMARVQTEVKDYTGALTTLAQVRKLPLTPDKEPVVILLRARAYSGADSTARAMRDYKDVEKRFARGMYGAEASFRLGELYEGMDSLKAAQKHYQEVPKAYSSSEFADEAIRRSSDIGRVLKIEETSGDDSPEAVALRTFSMAEVQLFQFNSTEKAIPAYEKIVNEFGDTEYAPRSAYALGYIYGVVLGDSVKAREWYDVLRTRYGDSQQAQLAYAFYKGASPPPPVSEMMRFAKAPKTPTSPGAPPRSTENRPVTPTPPPPGSPVLPDSVRDSNASSQPAPPDTSAPALPDTSQ